MLLKLIRGNSKTSISHTLQRSLKCLHDELHILIQQIFPENELQKLVLSIQEQLRSLRSPTQSTCLRETYNLMRDVERQRNAPDRISNIVSPRNQYKQGITGLI